MRVNLIEFWRGKDSAILCADVDGLDGYSVIGMSKSFNGLVREALDKGVDRAEREDWAEAGDIAEPIAVDMSRRLSADRCVVHSKFLFDDGTD